jgi:hypothetical protein
LTGSSEEDSAIDADAGLESGIISFVVVAIGGEVRFHAISIDVSGVSNIALANDAVVGLVCSAGLARSKDPEVSFIAVALSVFQVSVDAAILVAAALSVDD